MVSRITIRIGSDEELVTVVNKQGHDLSTQEFPALSPSNEHFHLGAFDGTAVEQLDRPTGLPKMSSLRQRSRSDQTSGIESLSSCLGRSIAGHGPPECVRPAFWPSLIALTSAT